MKRMKKRKELNSLLGSRRPQHPQYQKIVPDTLLSSSSDGDVYIAPTSSNYGMATKRISRTTVGGICSFRRVIRICLPICFLSLVAACITACIGIVWMQVQLQTDLERIKLKITKLDNWQESKGPSVNKLHESVAKLQTDLEQLDNRENGVSDLANKFNTLQVQFEKEVTEPLSAIADVKKDFQDLLNRVKTLEDKATQLQSSVGKSNELQSTLQGKADANQNEINKLNQEVKDKMSEENVKLLVPKLTSEIKASVENVNTSLHTLSDEVHGLRSSLDKTEEKLSDAENKIKVSTQPVNKDLIDKVNKLYDKVFNSETLQEQKNNEIHPQDGAVELKTGAVKSDEVIVEATTPSHPINDEVHQAKFVPIPSHHTDTQIGDTTASVTVLPTDDELPVNGS